APAVPSFPVHGISMHVDLDGPEEAPLVVFLHGALAAGAAFRSQRVALRDRFRLAFVDLRGHGRSTHLGGDVPWDTLDYATMTQDVRELVDILDADRPVHLVGASMGGVLAARVCAEAPARVASLALLGTSAIAGPKRAAYFGGLTPETLPLSTQRLSAMWHGEPYWRELARQIFARIAIQTADVYPSRLAPPRALVMQATGDEVLEPREAEVWVERIDAPTTLVRPPGDHAFFADGRAGSRAANAALRAHLISPGTT
ncbi:MAG TPA: alpha/beta fold hydrolase, partial [Candidatus Thermoplasmatota archaeon]|nr:alpha/beta fold hydrolase [Candidatus Thermoplasmatota archaeon]